MLPVPLTIWALLERAWKGSEREVLWEHFSLPEIAPARETFSLKCPLEKTYHDKGTENATGN